MNDLTTNNPPLQHTMALTNAQRLIWTGQSLNPDRPLYNMAMCFQLYGTLEVKIFQRAFWELVQKSDALRTVFHEEQTGVQQMILQKMDGDLPFFDWTTEPSSREQLKNWCREKSRHQFDLSQKLFDSALIKLAEKHFVWFFNQHHLITDAWAMTLLYRAQAAIYEALLAGDSSDEIILPVFREYALQQTSNEDRPQQLAAREYWKNKVADLPRPPQFYGHTNRTNTSGSERIVINLGAQKTEALRQLAQRPGLRSWTEHSTLFNIFASLLMAYTYRVSGQHKLALGTPAHHRTNARQREIPGLFIELFPLLTELDTEETFLSLFQKTRDETNRFLKYAHAGTSTPELSRSYNVVLNYINASFPDFNGLPLWVDWVHPDHVDPAHHLRLQVHDLDRRGEIQLHFDLNTEVFDEALREEVPKHFLRLMDGFLADPENLIAEVPLVEDVGLIGEAKVLSGAFESTATVLDIFSREMQKNQDLPAIYFEDHQLTYRELEERSNQLAHFLLQNGLEKGGRVALLFRRSPELLISIWAVIKAGGVFVPVPVNYPSGRVLGIIHDAGAALVLSTAELSNFLDLSSQKLIRLDTEAGFMAHLPKSRPAVELLASDLAYLLYTSGSSGLPKGVMISHGALSHYIQWAKTTYTGEDRPVMPLFTSIGFDLTITTLFMPLLAGGAIVCYPELEGGADLALLQVVQENRVNIIKLTPSHLGMIKGQDHRNSRIRTMIVGGEFFKSSLAQDLTRQFGDQLQIYNEYGPTEATVGCIVHRYETTADQHSQAVPIGRPIARTQAYILDEHQHPVPQGVVGELYLAGSGLAEGYWNQPQLTDEKFVSLQGNRWYRSGDLVRMNRRDQLEYLGRKDEQVKIGGRRVELDEISSALSRHPAIRNAVVSLQNRSKNRFQEEEHNCIQCGLPSNYPTAEFDEQGVCHLCRSFQSYQENVQQYFRTLPDLKALFAKNQERDDITYDCIMLLSGGKDSTYALGQLVEMGLNVLAFTLDNGYISEQAKTNIRRVVSELGVDHIFGETPAMNEIFVDSLQRHCNVCDGCFKTIYTLSIQLALEKNIPYIVTGLSRGQFFETRLTEELFKKENFNADEIDEIILNARKAYHRVDDAIKRLMDVSMFETDEVFEKVQFVDFYRYTDVSLDEMYTYLDQRLPWVRPTDTGRSTNCLINQAGIFVHKKEKGYSNYAFPYSWDVRIGHKTREASLEEINETIDEGEAMKILDEIGYTEAEAAQKGSVNLVAYYTADEPHATNELRDFLQSALPDYMIPLQFIHLNEMPLTVNGKIDKEALPEPELIRPSLQVEYIPPRNDMETLLAEIWGDLLGMEQIGVFDNFIDIGGDSLTGIRLMTRVNETLDLDLPINLIFEKTTIASMATSIETTIQTLLAEMERAG